MLRAKQAGGVAGVLGNVAGLGGEGLQDFEAGLLEVVAVGGGGGLGGLLGAHGFKCADDLGLELLRGAVLRLDHLGQLALHARERGVLVVEAEFGVDLLLRLLDPAHQAGERGLLVVEREFLHHFADALLQAFGRDAVAVLEFAHQAGQRALRVVERKLAQDGVGLGGECLFDVAAQGGEEAVGFVGRELLHQRAVLADMAGQGLGQALLGLLDLGAHELFQLAVLAHQALDPLVEAAVLRIEIVLEGAGEQGLGLAPVILQPGFHFAHQALALVLHRFGVDAALGLLERDDANAQARCARNGCGRGLPDRRRARPWFRDRRSRGPGAGRFRGRRRSPLWDGARSPAAVRG